MAAAIEGLAVPSHFTVVRPATVEEAIALKSRHGPMARFWAGGTDMTLLWQRRQIDLDLCIDLTSVKTHRTIEVAGSEIRIGALATLAQLERSAAHHPLLAMLSDVTKLMCTPQTRSIATIGGNICNASPAADLSPCLVALDATATLAGPAGERTIPLEAFFTGPKRTALEQAEVMTSIRIPLPGKRLAAAYRRVARTVVDIALVNGSASLLLDDFGRVTRARIALGAVGPVILRSPGAEAMLTGLTVAGLTGPAFAAAGEQAASDARPIDDVRASADYRRRMIAVMVRRALTDCLNRLPGS
jgi:carbon-monoxide dehydrogenase medium subunit